MILKAFSALATNFAKYGPWRRGSDSKTHGDVPSSPEIPAAFVQSFHDACQPASLELGQAAAHPDSSGTAASAVPTTPTPACSSLPSAQRPAAQETMRPPKHIDPASTASATSQIAPCAAEEAEPDHMVCGITYKFMARPVMFVPSGRVYEREALVIHFLKQSSQGVQACCPLTRIKFHKKSQLRFLPELQTEIREHCKKHNLPPPAGHRPHPSTLIDIVGGRESNSRQAAVRRISRLANRGFTLDEAQCYYDGLTALLNTVREEAGWKVPVVSEALCVVKPSCVLLGVVVDGVQSGNHADMAHLVVKQGWMPQVVQLVGCEQPALQAAAAGVVAHMVDLCAEQLVGLQAVTAVARLLQPSTAQHVQHAAAVALYRMCWAEHQAVRRQALAALQRHMRLLHSRDATRQQSALSTLHHLLHHAHFQDPQLLMQRLQAFPPLLHALHSKHPSVLYAALLVAQQLAMHRMLRQQLINAGLVQALVRALSVGGSVRHVSVGMLRQLLAPTTDPALARAVHKQQSLLAQCHPVLFPAASDSDRLTNATGQQCPVSSHSIDVPEFEFDEDELQAIAATATAHWVSPMSSPKRQMRAQ